MKFSSLTAAALLTLSLAIAPVIAGGVAISAATPGFGAENLSMGGATCCVD